MYPQRMVRQALRLRLPVPIAVLLLALLLALTMVGCTFGEGETEASQNQRKALKGAFDLPNGRSLYIECRGSGSPTVVEAGLGMPRDWIVDLQKPLTRQYMTCTYDRATMGSSGKAPTPQTAGEIVSDLHQLLQTADVGGPYVLVGHSAGGFFVQLYGRRCPDAIVGVVALNAVPPAHPWLERVLPRFNKEERKEELAFYRGRTMSKSTDLLVARS